MTPNEIAQLAQILQAAVSGIPQILVLGQKAKEFIDALFAAKLITIDEQNALKLHMDDIMQAAMAGKELPHWQVQPDPS